MGEKGLVPSSALDSLGPRDGDAHLASLGAAGTNPVGSNGVVRPTSPCRGPVRSEFLLSWTSSSWLLVRPERF